MRAKIGLFLLSAKKTKERFVRRGRGAREKRIEVWRREFFFDFFEEKIVLACRMIIFVEFLSKIKCIAQETKG